MPRKIGVLVFAIVVFAASFLVEWAGTGGLDEPLDLSDSRVIAASQHLEQTIDSNIRGRRTFSAKCMADGRRRRIQGEPRLQDPDRLLADDGPV